MLRYKNTPKGDTNLLEQVLKQGEALRASMVQTILRNEPTYEENAQKPPKITPNNELQLTLDDKHACLAYMNGDPMSNDEEQRALDTFRSLSGSDICDLTSRSFSSTQNNCKCQTCEAYCKLNFNQKLQSWNRVPALNLKPKTRKHTEDTSMRRHDNYEVFHYVNSLKIALHSFSITTEGRTKLCDAVNCERTTQKAAKFPELNITYFIEYSLPQAITKCGRKQSKIDTGLNSVNFVKKCSKNVLNNVIYFKQLIIHDIENLDIVNLEDVELILKLTARTLRQRNAVILGIGKVHFSEFYNSPSLSFLNGINFYLTDESPIITGSLKIQLQLGCDRLYFGKDFIDSLQNKENQNQLKDSTGTLEETFTLENLAPKQTKPKKVEIIQVCESSKNETIKKQSKFITKIKEKPKEVKTLRKNSDKPEKVEIPEKCVTHSPTTPKEKLILFGFIFISDVEYQQSYGKSYFTCQPFCQQDFVCSNVTHGGVHTCFNYHQVIPYVYDEDFLFNLRENHMILEFFTSQSATYSGDEVIGICKVPLHQYYLAFRNPVIIKYLERNRLPVIGTDWHEPIKDVTSGAINGTAQILVALGSEEQVRNLQAERGFSDDIVRRSKSIIQSKTVKNNVETQFERQKVRRNTSHKIQVDKRVKTVQTTPPSLKIVEKVDKSTLVTPTLTENNLKSKLEIVEKMSDSDKVNVDNRLETIQNYLQQLVALKNETELQPATMDLGNEPIAAPNLNNVNINGDAAQPRPTSSLLDTLQGVMNLDLNTKKNFKAQIVVESALHLPARKKCRVRKVKGKVIREELLPSTYVSYEIKDGVVKTSHVVQKTTSPTWNMKHDVAVPHEYLTTSNRRLVFKIWRKCNNGSTIPNMQIDTIIGFATVDLTVLRAGLPTIEGWFNIMDFNNKCNGQIKINITPLEDITIFSKSTHTSYTTTPSSATAPQPPVTEPSSPDETFSRALKRKFIELEEISQRLKARLHHVTEDLLPEDDADQNDESADEFEKDINTLWEEDESEVIDFAKEAQDMNLRRVSTSLHQWQQQDAPMMQELMITTDQDNNSTKRNAHANNQKHEMALQLVSQDLGETTPNLKTFIPETAQGPSPSSSSTSTLDRQLNEGKERIDHLLQRLTLLSTAQKSDLGGIGCSNRHVSGEDTLSSSSSIVGPNLEEDILSELDLEDFDATKLFNTSLESFNGNLEALLGRNFRDAPDGEGNTTESSSDDK